MGKVKVFKNCFLVVGQTRFTQKSTHARYGSGCDRCTTAFAGKGVKGGFCPSNLSSRQANNAGFSRFRDRLFDNLPTHLSQLVFISWQPNSEQSIESILGNARLRLRAEFD